MAGRAFSFGRRRDRFRRRTATNPIFAARAEAEYHRAQTQFQSNTNDPAAAWQFARACFDFADFATNNTERAALASQGIAACRQSLARESNSAPGHYYLAMNSASWRDTKRNLARLKMVREMEREFKTAAELDEHFDYAGPARCLGLLYRDAPGWPVSIGSRRKAREWLEQAVETRARLSRKPFEPGRIVLAMEGPRSRRQRIENARRALAGGANEFYRRSVGTKLG